MLPSLDGTGEVDNVCGGGALKPCMEVRLKDSKLIPILFVGFDE